jgi:hypothetical protein
MIRWIALVLISVSCGPAKKLPEYKSSEVKLLDSSHEKDFTLLPSEGSSSKTFWSGSEWSREKALINWRWNSPMNETIDYSSPYQIELFLMTQEELAALSPAEKFDLLMGRYDFPLKEEVYGNLKKPFDPAYATQIASLFHSEPKIKLVTNRDGLSIPFGASDIKALLAYHYGHKSPPIIGDAIGKVCHEDGCSGDLDAGTFHVTLANIVGRKRKAIFVDIDSNETTEAGLVVKYKSSVSEEFLAEDKAPPGSTKVIKILNQVSFLESLPEPRWEETGANYIMKEFSYYLYLNLKNEIIGGKWASSKRPDFLWVIKRETEFSDLLEGMEQLLTE